ncbi:uncharacterized protein [Amphiura filiformis]|uniref:uncharacterized protein n=1 Tax=Amphiura filiformis TaxID=82378 RepID=UPI003B20BC59
MILSVVFLAIAIISSLGSTQSQQSQPENNCNTCCQGPGGIPGTPGTAGQHGLPGRDGRDARKGDKGESGINIKGDKGDDGFGQIGLPGPQGIRGEKGDKGLQGVSVPGKTGPRGPVGSMGIQGITGEAGSAGTIGQKGQKGQCGQGRRSAFTAIKTSAQTGNTNDVVTFQETSANINGHFSLATSKFTCVIPGTYVFTFTIGIHEPTDIYIKLVLNGNHTVGVHTRTGGISNDFDTTSSSAILNLQSGDQVWLMFGSSSSRRVAGSSKRYTSFSGFLLYEN